MISVSISAWIRRFLSFVHSEKRSLIAGLALTAFFYSPVTQVMDTDLDSSNFASYTYFAAHHFQYGPEVVPMSGPYGYVMYGSVYNGLLFWKRFVAQLICAGVFSGFILWFFNQCSGCRWRWLWLALLSLLSPAIQDLPFELLMMLSGLFLMRRPPKGIPIPWMLLASGALGFISLIKGTHLVLSLATLGVVLTYHFWLRNWRSVIVILAGYAFSFLSFWLLASQSLGHIPSFLAGTLALTNGYNEAMAINESPDIFLHGISAFGILFSSFAWGLWHRRRNLETVAATLLFSGYTFVEWKHGFVRADGHIFIFQHYASIAAAFWFLVVFANRQSADSKKVRLVGILLMIVGIIAGLWTESARIAALRIHWQLTDWTVEHLRTNARQLLQPARSKAKLDEQLALQRATCAMPVTKREIGNNSIDLFGLQHGIIPLNEMNYHPRPMGGGTFNVYNPYLMQLNQKFLRDRAKRPDYYLLRFETIDNRIGSQDDGLSLLEIIHRYEPVNVEQGHVLMKAMPDSAANELQPLSRRTFKFSEFVPVPRVSADQLLIVRFDVRPNLKGRLRSTLYKAPLMFMTLQGVGIEQPESRRFVPSMAASPFLFSPTIENNGDLLSLYTKGEGKQLTGFFIYSEGADCYEAELGVEFFTLPRPVLPVGKSVDDLLAFTRFPIANVVPETVVPADAQQLSLRNLFVQKLLPPAEIRWKLDGSESEFNFEYGFMPEAYERGSSNGVVFTVELRFRNEPPQVLFQKLLDPAKQKTHRGNQTAHVPLPIVKPGSRLVLRTDPGEYGDDAWDWAYATRMEIKRERDSFAQNPIFSRSPESVEAANSATLELDKRKVFLLHVPGALNFATTGTERYLYLEFGFLPGAYTGDGRTSGADYVIEVVRQNQSRQEIFRRTLQPVSAPGDRGLQSAEIDLPALKPGDKIVVRTDVAPGGSNSFGWTYIARLIMD